MKENFPCKPLQDKLLVDVMKTTTKLAFMTGKETGFLICESKKDKKLSFSSICLKGAKRGIDIESECKCKDEENTIGSYHVHPILPIPSQNDLETSLKLRHEYNCIGGPDLEKNVGFDIAYESFQKFVNRMNVVCLSPLGTERALEVRRRFSRLEMGYEEAYKELEKKMRDDVCRMKIDLWK